MFNEFKKFIMRGNFVDLAIGFTVGAAFTTVVKSAVNDLLMPPIGMALGSVEFEDSFWLLRDGDPAAPYRTLEAAQEAGAVTVNYGVFVNNVISLLFVGLALFVIVRLVNRLDSAMDEVIDHEPVPEGEPAHKKCPYCRSQIAFRAVRCRECTSRLEGFEQVALETAGPTTEAG